MERPPGFFEEVINNKHRGEKYFLSIQAGDVFVYFFPLTSK